MSEAHQHNLLLLLARDLASNLATALFIVDHKGRTVFFNERAEELLGATFAEARLRGAVFDQEWDATDLEGHPLPRAQWPILIAVRERRALHQLMCLKALDGEQRCLAVTAFPLHGNAGELVGAMAVFWEEDRGAR